MKNIRTIIIDSNNVAVNNLKSHFNDCDSINVVASFEKGDEALSYILDHKSEIDLILMDIIIPGLDGISLLNELKDRNISIKTIVISNYKDEFYIKECSNLNVSYYILKPFSVLALEKRVNELFDSKAHVIRHTENVDMEICQLLHNLGIPSHIRGYKYIRDGIMIIYNNLNTTFLITKEIYPQIAIKYATTPSRVERAIRHAIEVSWIRGDLALMEDIFGFSVSCDKAKPTNSEFLSTIADRIKMTLMAN